MGHKRLDSVLNLDSDWRSCLAELEVVGVHDLTKAQAVNATIAYFSGQLNVLEARSWARWVLNRPDVRIDDDRVREFLQDWSDESIVINDESVDVWQSRLAHD